MGMKKVTAMLVIMCLFVGADELPETNDLDDCVENCRDINENEPSAQGTDRRYLQTKPHLIDKLKKNPSLSWVRG
ncbi:hypothetical protein CsSME_00033500 [Camellia sinensis var. sinensis]